MLYVLAEAGQGDLTRTVRLTEERERIGLYAQAYLALALGLLTEEEFDRYREAGERMGFKAVFSSRLVRSSFMAGTFLKQALRS